MTPPNPSIKTINRFGMIIPTKKMATGVINDQNFMKLWLH